MGEVIRTTVGLVAIFGIVFGLMIVAYDDESVVHFYKKLRCGLGLHKRRARYYCQLCKKPRRHPPLKIIDGGNKMKSNTFKF